MQNVKCQMTNVKMINNKCQITNAKYILLTIKFLLIYYLTQQNCNYAHNQPAEYINNVMIS